ncbi:DNA-binding protein [Streptomyces armeniacus]|uniref:DNA-binding protein n=1 Tax=Streptomyces armeniacus TaxID=83291 RepID=A0A345XSN1_9ACTN|nr:helix-turn-helix domain-containing protein [Streptomyces armeniacus]AXK34647.1 DNA-binding protein [Streptomyces armeniacus]
MNPNSGQDGEHGEDVLLTAEQAADILGIGASTLRAYAARGEAPSGRKIGRKRRWTLREIEHHRDHPPSANPARTGRPPGARDTRRRRPTARGSLAARRAAELAGRLADGDTVTTEQIMSTYGVTERTAQRLLKRARSSG